MVYRVAFASVLMLSLGVLMGFAMGWLANPFVISMSGKTLTGVVTSTGTSQHEVAEYDCVDILVGEKILHQATNEQIADNVIVNVQWVGRSRALLGNADDTVYEISMTAGRRTRLFSIFAFSVVGMAIVWIGMLWSFRSAPNRNRRTVIAGVTAAMGACLVSSVSSAFYQLPRPPERVSTDPFPHDVARQRAYSKALGVLSKSSRPDRVAIAYYQNELTKLQSQNEERQKIIVQFLDDELGTSVPESAFPGNPLWNQWTPHQQDQLQHPVGKIIGIIARLQEMRKMINDPGIADLIRQDTIRNAEELRDEMAAEAQAIRELVERLSSVES
jgi:hypothetical protein